MFYKRKLLKKVRERIKDKEIIVITGMRRVGKTTLCQMIFDEIKSKNKLFLDMENPIEQKIFEEKDYNNIIFNLKELGVNPSQKMYIFLDEIQAMPNVVKAVKYLYDHHNIKFFLTGSSSFYLKNLFPESLAGRKFVFELYPLDFEEFLVFKGAPKKFYSLLHKKIKQKNRIAYEKTKKYYAEYLEFGGFPAVVLAKDKEIKILKLKDIFKSYFEKDVKILANFREIKIFRDLILLLMQRTGSKIEISKISSQLGVSRETIYSFLSFLEDTYFASFIRPFSRSVDREVSGSRKVYICDNGFLNYFAKISSGAGFENAAFLNLRKYGKINYYQKRSGAEIDFIVNEKAGLEVKQKGTRRDYEKLKKIGKSLKLKECYLITQEFSNDQYSIPALYL